MGVANPDKCIFVASPFLLGVMGSDAGSVARLDVSNQGNNSLRMLNALSKATPQPGSPTQGDPVFGTFANPGSPFDPNANGSQLSYFDFDAQKGGPVFDVANLEATFEFVAGQPPNGVFLVEAVNASGVFSRIINYRVKLAGSARASSPGSLAKLCAEFRAGPGERRSPLSSRRGDDDHDGNDRDEH